MSRESGAETTTENFLDTLTKGLAQLQNQLQNQVETTFTKENADVCIFDRFFVYNSAMFLARSDDSLFLYFIHRKHLKGSPIL